MFNTPLPFTDKLNEFFYEGIYHQTSASLYGSAATGNWIPGRSDLDLIIYAPKEKQELLGQKIRKWASLPSLPILDGYALIFSERNFVTIRIDAFTKSTFPSSAKIDLIDQWNIKYRSKHLFGKKLLNDFFPEITPKELSNWARNCLKNLLVSNPECYLSNTEVILPKLIWIISWSARMLMLVSENICESKRESLEWLANEYTEIRHLVYLLLDDYSKSNETTVSITREQSVSLRKFCFELLSKV